MPRHLPPLPRRELSVKLGGIAHRIWVHVYDSMQDRIPFADLFEVGGREISDTEDSLVQPVGHLGERQVVKFMRKFQSSHVCTRVQ